MWKDERDIDEFVFGIELDFATRWPRLFGRPPLPPSDEVWQEFCWKNSREHWIAQLGSEEKARAYCRTLKVADAGFESHPFLEWALRLAPTLLADDWSRVSVVPVRPSYAVRFNSLACRRIADNAFVILIFLALAWGAVDLNQHMLHWLLDFDPRDSRSPKGLRHFIAFFKSRQRMMRCAHHMALRSDPPPSRWRVTRHHGVASASAQLQVLFVLLHELAHVFHGHLGKLQSIAASSNGVPGELKVASAPELEFEADQTAFHWLLRLVEHPSLVEGTGLKPDSGAIRFAIELATQILFANMAAVGRWEHAGFGTHPPPMERARALTGVPSPMRNRSPQETMAALVTLMRLEMWALPSDRRRAQRG